MLVPSGAAGMAWLLAVEPIVKTAASAAAMRLVFIVYLLLCFVLFAEISLRKDADPGGGPASQAAPRGLRVEAISSGTGKSGAT
jgi:hypothetical protein